MIVTLTGIVIVNVFLVIVHWDLGEKQKMSFCSDNTKSPELKANNRRQM